MLTNRTLHLVSGVQPETKPLMVFFFSVLFSAFEFVKSLKTLSDYNKEVRRNWFDFVFFFFFQKENSNLLVSPIILLGKL